MRILLVSLSVLLVAAMFISSDISANDADKRCMVPAKSFTLTDANGEKHTIEQYKGKIVVLEWTNPGCPYVIGHYSNGHMPQVQKEMTAKGVIWLTVNSTNSEHKDSKTADEIKRIYSEWSSAATAHLIDRDGAVGKMYGAKTTPHLFVIDKNGNVAYDGAIDDDRSTNGGKDATINYVTKAISELEAGKEVWTWGTKPYGCGVKYQ
jgi:peroxiredoxin